MKKIIPALFTTVIIGVGIAFAQDAPADLPKIAVYVTGSGVSENEKKALGTRMLASLVNSGRYMGIERAGSFLAEVDKEQLKQRSGAIDDGQISALGKQFGVNFVCIADITPVLGDYQVSARIINVETAQVSFIGESISPMKTANDLMQAANEVVKNMFGGQVATLRGAKLEQAQEPPPQTAPTPTPAAPRQTSDSGQYFIDTRDGQKYRAVKIGGQTWMAENLNYKTGRSWCYGNEEHNCKQYGRLYDWETAKGACPNGWHLPSRGEWNGVVSAAGGKGTAGKKLKSKTGWKDKKGRNGTDEFGFSALPGGHRYYSGGSFGRAGYYGYWWSATENGAGYAYGRNMYYDGDGVGEGGRDESNGFSVRCVGVVKD